MRALGRPSSKIPFETQSDGMLSRRTQRARVESARALIEKFDFLSYDRSSHKPSVDPRAPHHEMHSRIASNSPLPPYHFCDDAHPSTTPPLNRCRRAYETLTQRLECLARDRTATTRNLSSSTRIRAKARSLAHSFSSKTHSQDHKSASRAAINPSTSRPSVASDSSFPPW